MRIHDVYRVTTCRPGRGHIVAAARLQLVFFRVLLKRTYLLIGLNLCCHLFATVTGTQRKYSLLINQRICIHINQLQKRYPAQCRKVDKRSERERERESRERVEFIKYRVT